jgi:hypothetical protein
MNADGNNSNNKHLNYKGCEGLNEKIFVHFLSFVVKINEPHKLTILRLPEQPDKYVQKGRVPGLHSHKWR